MNIKYEVNEEKRIVTAIMFDVYSEVKQVIYKQFKTNDALGIIGYIIHYVTDIKDFNYKNKIVAIAKCHPDDEWNVEKGKFIAKSRLMISYSRYIEYTIRYINDYLINNYIGKFYKILYDSNDHKHEWMNNLNDEIHYVGKYEDFK